LGGTVWLEKKGREREYIFAQRPRIQMKKSVLIKGGWKSRERAGVMRSSKGSFVGEEKWEKKKENSYPKKRGAAQLFFFKRVGDKFKGTLQGGILTTVSPVKER